MRNLAMDVLGTLVLVLASVLFVVAWMSPDPTDHSGYKAPPVKAECISHPMYYLKGTVYDCDEDVPKEYYK